jgi:hypothetical protein
MLLIVDPVTERQALAVVGDDDSKVGDPGADAKDVRKREGEAA